MTGMLRVSKYRALVALAIAYSASTACHQTPPSDHADHAAAPSESEHVMPGYQDAYLPPDATRAHDKLAKSPRHGEWVVIAAGPNDSVRAWVVYPQRSTKAPVVVVVHEIFGLSTWVRAVTDQVAAGGFIAIAPDLLTSKHIPGSPDSVNADSAVAAIRTLNPQDVQRELLAAANYGMALPAAVPRYGIVGFCWGGAVSFAHATYSPTVGAAVVFYGVSPDLLSLGKVRAPVLGLYGGDDARVDATIPPADSALTAMGRTYKPIIYAGAGHAFLRNQSGQDGANLTATRQAWPAMIGWFRDNLEIQH